VYVVVRDTTVSYTRLVDGAPVSGLQSLPGGVTGSPVVAALPSGEGLHVVVRGTGHDYLYGHLAGTVWSGWVSLGGNFTSDPAIVVTSWGLAICGRASDERVWVRRIGPPSSGWVPLPGQVGADPTMALDPADARSFWVFTRGISNETYGQRGDDSGMGGRGPLAGAVIADTVAVTDTSGLFLFGQAVDSTVIVNRLSGASWSGWNPLGMPSLPIRAV
jgi:hypothetical protein